MAWIVIRNSDGAFVSGPHAQVPKTTSGQSAVTAALGFPGRCMWDAAARGFFYAEDVKRIAADRIDAIAPPWKQINDLAALIAGPLHAEYAAAKKRREDIDAVRRWSNTEEAKLTAVTQPPG